MQFIENDDERPWHKLIRDAQLSIGQVRLGRVGLKKVVMTRTPQNDVRVFDNRCPHAGAPLSGGVLKGEFLICPRHHWEFHVQDGHCPEHPNFALKPYRIRIEDGWIFAQERKQEIW